MPAEGSVGGLATESPSSSDKTTPGRLEDNAAPNMPKKHEGDVCRELKCLIREVDTKPFQLLKESVMRFI